MALGIQVFSLLLSGSSSGSTLLVGKFIFLEYIFQNGEMGREFSVESCKYV